MTERLLAFFVVCGVCGLWFVASGINALYGVTPSVFYGVRLSAFSGARHKAVLELRRHKANLLAPLCLFRHPLMTLTDAAEREQRANLFALCRAARRKSLQSRVNAKCKMYNTECKMQNAKCRMQNAECRMQNAECKMQNAECKMQNAKCKMQN